MIRVDIESPYSGPDPEAIARNIRYARACVRDSLVRGEVPFASHLLYTQPGILDDANAADRERGIAAGKAVVAGFDLTAVYTDLGVTGGMMRGIDEARANGRRVEYRQLGHGWDWKPERDGWTR